MATTLADIIKRRLGTAEAPVPAADATQQQAQVLGAKAGKAAPVAEGVQQTNIGEQQQAQVNQQQLGQIAEEGRIKGAEQEQQGLEQKQSYALAGRELDQKRAQVQQSAQRNFSQIEKEHQMAGNSLDFEKQKALAEQAGFVARLNNEKYVTALQNVAERQRLDSAAAIKDKLVKDAFSDEMAATRNASSFSRILDEGEREWQQRLGEMDINTALQIMNTKLSEESQRMMWQGIGNIGGAAISNWAGSTKPNTGTEEE